MSELLVDRAGRHRSPATLPGFHAGHAPGNKGLSYPADPPKVEEIVAVMRVAGDRAHRPAPTRTDRDLVASGAARPADPRVAAGSRSYVLIAIRSRRSHRAAHPPPDTAPSRHRHQRAAAGQPATVTRAR